MKVCNLGDVRVTVQRPSDGKKARGNILPDGRVVDFGSEQLPIDAAKAYAHEHGALTQGNVLIEAQEPTVMQFACVLLAIGFTLAPRFTGILTGNDENATDILNDEFSEALDDTDPESLAVFTAKLLGVSKLPPRSQPTVRVKVSAPTAVAG